MAVGRTAPRNSPAAVLTVAMYFGALRLNLTTFFRYTAISSSS